MIAACLGFEFNHNNVCGLVADCVDRPPVPISLSPLFTMDAVTKRGILQSLASVVRVGVRPQTIREWIEVLESAGFKVQQHQLAPMHLLELRRVIRDEGFWRTLRFVFNVLRTPEARSRVLQMRDVFRRHQKHLAAIMLIAEKP